MTKRNYSKGWVLFDEARELIPLGTGTHSKAAQLRNREPAYLVKGAGCRVWDADGNEYIDYRNALGPISLGYAYPPVQEAIARQLQDGIIFSCPHPLELELARDLVDLIPSIEQLRYLKTGGEAMAACITLARAFTSKPLILSCGYHGWLQTVHDQKGILPSVADSTLRYTYGDIEAVERLLHQHRGQVAAVTIAGSYPDMEPHDTFPRALRELTHQHDTLLIVDEIVTGFRLNTAGWQGYYNLHADLCVYAKGLANGMPLSVYAGRKDVMSMSFQTAIVSSTFSGETLSLAAAKAVIQVYRTEPVIETLWARGMQLRDGMQRIFSRYHIPIEIKGLPPCPRLVFPGGDQGRRVRAALFSAMADEGVLLFDVPYVNYSHQKSDIDMTLDRLDRVCRALDLNALDEIDKPVIRVIGAGAS